MPLFIHKNGTWKMLTPWVRKAGIWKLLTASARTGGSWGTPSTPLSVVLDTTSIVTVEGDDQTIIRGGSSTATPSGGSAPYSYAWTRESGDTLDVDGAATAIASFSVVPTPAQPVFDAIYRCTVTDNLGATAYALVSVHLEYTGTFT